MMEDGVVEFWTGRRFFFLSEVCFRKCVVPLTDRRACRWSVGLDSACSSLSCISNITWTCLRASMCMRIARPHFRKVVSVSRKKEGEGGGDYLVRTTIVIRTE